MHACKWGGGGSWGGGGGLNTIARCVTGRPELNYTTPTCKLKIRKIRSFIGQHYSYAKNTHI